MGSQTKILHVISSLSRGGRERQLLNIMLNTDLIKFPSYIVYFNHSSAAYDVEEKIAECLIKVKSRCFIYRLKEISRIIKDLNPEVVYTWGNLESIFILFIKPFHRFKFINGSIRHGIRAKRFSHVLRTAVLHMSESVVANTFTGLKVNKIKRGKVLYNGIDNDFLKTIKPEELAKIRESLPGRSAINTLLISVANLVPYKDFTTVCYALSLTKEKGYLFHYIIIGEGPEKEKIEQLINRLDLGNEITLMGRRSDIKELLSVANIFIHSSKGEGCSNAILEAMAVGLPVIASDTGGTNEIVDSSVGRLFEYQNINQLTERIIELLNDKSQSEYLGQTARKRVEDKFSLDKMMFEYYSIIQQVLLG